jgi:hypothetical protein
MTVLFRFRNKNQNPVRTAENHISLRLLRRIAVNPNAGFFQRNGKLAIVLLFCDLSAAQSPNPATIEGLHRKFKRDALAGCFGTWRKHFENE